MSQAEHAWVWPALRRLAAIAAQQEEAEKETARLREAYAAEHARIHEAVPDLSVQDAVNAIRLIGPPDGTIPDGADAPSADADTKEPGDPLDIPPYLKRGEESVAADGSATPVQNDAEVLAQRGPPT